MTTINNIEDLARILETHPHWATTLRALVLGEEVLNLPQTVAVLATNVSKLAESVQRLETGQEDLPENVAGLKAGQEELRENVAGLKAGQEELRAGQDELRQDVTGLRSDVNELKTGQQELASRQPNLERSMDGLRDDFAPIKGRYAQSLAQDQSVAIAFQMGLFIRSQLTPRELADMLRENDTSDLPRNELNSFVVADLMFSAEDDDYQLWHIAVEASYTADERDTYRAKRNAQFLTRFTGVDSRAVVAAVRMDDRIQAEVDSGDVFWYRIDPRAYQEV